MFQRHGGLPEDPNPDSPYQQQLKMAYLQGLRSEISQFVWKHDVKYTTDGMNQIMNWARDAQDVIKKKKKPKAEEWATTFSLMSVGEPEEEEIYYYDRATGQTKVPTRGKFRGGMAGRGRRYGQGRGGPPQDDRCYACGKTGHFIRECPYRRGNQRGRGHTRGRKRDPPFNPDHKPKA